MSLTIYLVLVIATYGLVMLIIVGVPKLRRWREKKSSDPLEEALVGIIEASLVEQPEEWTETRHCLHNRKRGISLWVANRDYGFGVSTDGNDVSPYDGDLSQASKKRLWQVAKAFKMRELADRFKDEDNG